MQKFRRILLFLLITLQLTAPVTVLAEDVPAQTLYAGAAVLMDADSGRILYDKNAVSVMPMASTTKIMTCILALETANVDETATASAYAASMPKVKLYTKKGEQYILRDLLYSLMLESHNDSAVVIAEHIGKNYLPEELRQKSTADFTVEESKKAVAAFAALMNKKAREIGCENTWFITPNGLDATETITLESGDTIVKEHSTTAADLARIMSYCILRSPMKESFLGITRTPSYSFSAGARSFSCVNHNAFLSMMSGALSGKTGFTNKAGYCYVGALERDGKTFVVALLACGWPNHKSYKWSDTSRLMEYGLDNYNYRSFQEVAFDPSVLKKIPVTEGQTPLLGDTAYINIGIAGREEAKSNDSMDDLAGAESGSDMQGLLLRDDEVIDVSMQVQKSLQAPVEAGTEVGKVTYAVNGQVYKTEQIITKDGVEKIDLRWCFLQVWKRFCV